MKKQMRRVRVRILRSTIQEWGSRILLLVLVVAANVYCRDAQAAITGVTGDVSLIAPPASVELDALVSDTIIFGFSEKRNFTLTSDLSINGSGAGVHGSGPGGGGTNGFIAAGTQVDSYFFHADPDDVSLKEYDGSITFDNVILGIIFLDTELHLSDSTLGLAGTSYLDHIFRDFEIGSECGIGVADCATISEDQKTLTLDLGATTFYDQIRVVTAVVPEPSSMMLVGLGMMGMFWLRRAK